MDAPDLERIVGAVLASKKYRAVCADTIRRIATRELEKHGSLRAAVKATKRRLHQVYGAFEDSFDYADALGRLRAAYGSVSPDAETEIKKACRSVLSLHVSTRERLPILERFYSSVFQVTGMPRSILDLGCGLNPLAVPWMGLDPQSRYVALDIDSARVGFLQDYLRLAGMEACARCQDILVEPPDDVADVALLLKMSPSLERQEAGATGRLIERLRTRFVVVSFAVKSLGGRDKGMLDQYERLFLDLAQQRSWPTETLVFDTELVIIVRGGEEGAGLRRTGAEPGMELCDDGAHGEGVVESARATASR